LTSAAHRLLTTKNDPDETMPLSLHPNTATGYRGWHCRGRCRCNLFLFLILFLSRTLVTATDADGATLPVHSSNSCNSG
jgi:hypothetical protein